MTGTFTIRLFAAARDAAGTAEVSVVQPAAAKTVGDVVDFLVAQYGSPDGQLAQVVARCSFLLDGQQAHREALLAGAQTLDVLPPFAGG